MKGKEHQNIRKTGCALYQFSGFLTHKEIVKLIFFIHGELCFLLFVHGVDCL